MWENAMDVNELLIKYARKINDCDNYRQQSRRK